MKILSIFAATALLASVLAGAAAPPATPAATPVKRPTLKVCNKQADGKKLDGAARAQFVKDCRAGKTD
jgi:psiF repeat